MYAVLRRSKKIISPLTTQSVRCLADKLDKNKIFAADPIEHATGNEKLLLILNEKGIDDPFQIEKIYPKGPATKDKPCIIPSPESKRLVGCYCQEDQTHIRFMWVHKDEMRRCQCGYWFKCVDQTDLRLLAYGKTEDSPEMF